MARIVPDAGAWRGVLAEGDSKVFGKEADAMKWLHTQAGNLGYASIDIRRK
jgi:hypothetical protein